MIAGQRATLRSANKEALHHFQRALALLDELGPDGGDVGCRIELHTEIGLIDMILAGWASKLADIHFIEAERLSRGEPHTERRFRTLVGMSLALTWSGHIADARSRAEEILTLADHTGALVHRVYAHQLHGQSDMYEGRYRAALTELHACLEKYDQLQDSQLAFRYGHDPALMSLWWSAYCLWMIGAMDRSLDTAERALKLGRSLGHPFSLATSLMLTVDLAYFMWLPERALLYGDEAVSVCRRYGFKHAEAFSAFQRGWAVARIDDCAKGIEEMSRALDQLKETGAGPVGVPRITAQLAGEYGLAGCAEEGFRVLESSPDRAPGRKRVRYPEISRIEGELYMRRDPPDTKKAEQLYMEAIAIAVEDGARSKQLRAATSLAQLWQSQGKEGEALELLQPLYESFDEGFKMPDMQMARVVLERLQTTLDSQRLRRNAK